jgi:hypothetical protein
MIQKIKMFKESGLFMLTVMLLCSLFGVVDAGAITADVIAGTEGGALAPGGINTAQFSRENSDNLLLNDIEKKVVKVNAGASVMTQLAFYATKRSATSMIQEHYLTDVLPDNTTLKTAYTAPASGNGVEVATIDTNNNDIFSTKETIIFPGVKGYNENGTEQTEQYFMAYILKKTDEGKLSIKAVNGKKIGNTDNSIPSLAADAKILRCGRAHNEIDMRTAPYAVVPTKKVQYLQSFRCQIEESTLQKIANKEVEWEFSDLEEAAVIDMKRGMSKNFLLGIKRKIYDENRHEVFFTGGVYWQAKRKFIYGNNPEGKFTFEELVHLSRTAFTGGNGSKRKYFLVGSDLLSELSLMEYANVQRPANSTHVRYGITFDVMVTKFGTLYVVHDETFDDAGMSDKGLIFDNSLLRKYSIYNMKTDDLDLRKSGEKDVDARTISEVSALLLQNPEAHVQVEKFVA